MAALPVFCAWAQAALKSAKAKMPMRSAKLKGRTLENEFIELAFSGQYFSQTTAMQLGCLETENNMNSCINFLGHTI
jgi:hypothetical protein